MLLTKISGLRDPEDIESIALLGPTYMTFDFVSLSKRYMGEVDASIFRKLPTRIRRTGRFSNQDTLSIVALAGRYGITTIELDGDETAAQCEQLSAEGLEVLKTIKTKDLINIANYEGVCNRLIFKEFNTQTVTNYNGKTPFLICSDELKIVQHQMFCGVDCGDTLESSVACKDINAVKNFLNFYKAIK